ncbi:PrgI family protein [Candidatus Saccharibacteria bacterium]|nr:PrgI family protein [Candidatus Saccharibacteria bacterium]
MAVYKVPQDVEAEDKLVGPFTFRQFIYMLIVAGAGGLSFMFIQAPIPLPFFSFITIPIGLAFLMLALPLRKDQPMEIYLLAILRFMLKPKRRIWSTDGVPATVMIDAPKVVEQHLTKDFDGTEAAHRLDYLAKIVDTRGWAAKGVDIPNAPSLSSQVVKEADDTTDVLDEDADIAKSFDALLAKQKEVSRNAAREQMAGIAQGMPYTPPSAMPPAYTPAPAGRAPLPPPPTPKVVAGAPADAHHVTATPVEPKPVTAQQPAAPVAAKPAATPPPPAKHPVHNTHTNHAGIKTEKIAAADKVSHLAHPGAAAPQAFQQYMTPQVSPAIMNLANNKDLSIQAIAHEAERLAQNDDQVVEIPLR